MQDSAPEGHVSLVSRLVTVAGDQVSQLFTLPAILTDSLLYLQRRCQMRFPEAFPEPPVANVSATNTAYGGWNTDVPRLFFANGQRTLSLYLFHFFDLTVCACTYRRPLA